MNHDDHGRGDSGPSTIDDMLPEYRYRIAASASIGAPRAAVWAELVDLRMSALPIGSALTRLRHLPGVLAGAETRVTGADKFFDVTPIPVLVSAEPSLIVSAGASQAWKLFGGSPPPSLDAARFPSWRADGWITVAMQFSLTELADGSGTLLATETRIGATDERTQRVFARYWWAIRAGSALIRREVVARVKDRAEADTHSC